MRLTVRFKPGDKKGNRWKEKIKRYALLRAPVQTMG